MIYCISLGKYIVMYEMIGVSAIGEMEMAVVIETDNDALLRIVCM